MVKDYEVNMEITEVRVKLIDSENDRLRAFCSMTIDNCFVVRDIKVIDGIDGLFAAMPSKKVSEHCRCGAKNYLRANFCSNCGKKLNKTHPEKKGKPRVSPHSDIAHPINTECRDIIQQAVLEAYIAELEKSKQPDYAPPTVDTGE